MLLMTLVYQDKPKIYRDKLESRPQKLATVNGVGQN